MRLHVTKYRIGARGHLVVRFPSEGDIETLTDIELDVLSAKLCDFSGPVGADIACFFDERTEKYVFSRSINGYETNAVDAAMAASADASHRFSAKQRFPIRLNDIDLEVEQKKTQSNQVIDVSVSMSRDAIRLPAHTELSGSLRSASQIKLSEIAGYKIRNRKLAIGDFVDHLAASADQEEAIKSLSTIFDDNVDVVSLTPSSDRPRIYYLLTVVEGEHRGMSCGDTAMIALDMAQTGKLNPSIEYSFVDIDGVTTLVVEKDSVRVSAYASLVFSAEIDWDGERLGSSAPDGAHRSYQLNANMQGIMDHQGVVKEKLETVGYSEFGNDWS